MKTTIKKVLTGVLALTLSVSMLAGCTSGTANDKDEQGRTVVSVGNWPANDGAHKTNIEKQKAEFEADNPTMAIKPDFWGFDVQTFYTKAASGQLPDVYYSNFTEIEKIKSGGYYTDLRPAMERHGYIDSLNPLVLELISNGDEIVTFPTSVYSLGFTVNMDLFREAGLINPDGTPMQPKDWNEVVEFSKLIKEKTGKMGFVLPTTNNNGGWLFTPIAWSFGVEFMKDNGDGTYTATFDSPEMVEALQWVRDLKWKYGVTSPNAIVTPDELNQQFYTGNVGMMMNTPNFKNARNFEMSTESIGVVAIPAGPKRHVTLVGGYMATLKNNCTEDQADVAIKWLEKTGKTFKLTDTVENERIRYDELYARNVESGEVTYGVYAMDLYADDTDSSKLNAEFTEKYRGIPVANTKLYNDSLHDDSIELQVEEPACAQELYSVLDGLLQEILSNEDANIPALIAQAQKDFQTNYLNNL